MGEGPGLVVKRLTQTCPRGAQVLAHCVSDKDEAAPLPGVAVPPAGRLGNPTPSLGALLLLKVRGSQVNRRACSVLLINASGKTFKDDTTPTPTPTPTPSPRRRFKPEDSILQTPAWGPGAGREGRGP